MKWTSIAVFSLLLAQASAPPALAAGDQSAPLKRKERFVLQLTDETSNEVPDSLVQTLHFTLEDDAAQQVGTMDVMIAITLVPENDGDPSRGIINTVATLADGKIVAQGVALLSDVTPTFTLGIVGGTGRYRTARGQVRVRPNDSGGRVAFRVLP